MVVPIEDERAEQADAEREQADLEGLHERTAPDVRNERVDVLVFDGLVHFIFFACASALFSAARNSLEPSAWPEPKRTSLGAIPYFDTPNVSR